MYVLTSPAYNPGFFSVFNSVLGSLHFYELEQWQGLEVDFQDRGLYYDKKYGPNWWSYYFEPLGLTKNSCDECKKFPTYKKIIFALVSQFEITREEGKRLIDQYIRIKPNIQEKINIFMHEHDFKNFYMIGIHYRGTDKVNEAPAVSYEEAIESIKKVIEVNASKPTKIFIATDDGIFLKEATQQFPTKVCAIDTIRSENGKPPHITNRTENYKKGQDALIDCFLLSQCNILIKCASNLSDCSMKFNPTIPVIHLSNSFAQKAVQYD